MFFQVLRRYPLLSRLTLMLACLGTLSYALFLSAELSARLAQASAVDGARSESKLSGIHLIQLALGGLFLVGCGLTLKEARRALVERTELALRRSAVPVAGAAPDESGDEVDRLARALEHTAASLGGRLAERERSAQLARSQERFATRSLEFIYRCSLQLTEANLTSATLQSLLEDMAASLEARACTLLLLAPVAEDLALPAAIGGSLSAGPPDQHALLEMSRGQIARRTRPGPEGEMIELALPVRDTVDAFGALVVEVRADFLFESRQSRLVETVAGLIALALGNLLRNQRRRRLALMDERSAIAGELHDSLAQALAYMKIQVARLQKELANSCQQCGTRENFKINEVSSEIRTGLDSAYRHLRELLTAFRTNMPPGGLQQALREVVDELDARAGTDITLDYQLGDLSLSVNEEFHVLQVVREALTNVIRHARARRARVVLDRQEGGEVRVLVEDDGRGALGDPPREGHYGLSIMDDRARQLGGSFHLEAGDGSGAGTRVVLRFVPRSRQA